MKILFDTDVVLDLLLDREPFAAAAAELFARVERGELGGFVSATTVSTCLGPPSPQMAPTGGHTGSPGRAPPAAAATWS